jgi:membrane-associated phospholipid phosphatase
LAPPALDVWLVGRLMSLLGRSQEFDELIEGAIHHNVLGGLWYAATLCLVWSHGIRHRDHHVIRRVLTIMSASGLAGAMSILAGITLSWIPPSEHPELANLYPVYLYPNFNASSFPSQSTAVYGTVAAGMYSLHRGVGAALLAGIPLVVALPRVYVGGHYLTDVLIGLVLAGAAYWTASALLEQRVVAALQRAMEGPGRAVWLGISLSLPGSCKWRPGFVPPSGSGEPSSPC